MDTTFNQRSYHGGPEYRIKSVWKCVLGGRPLNKSVQDSNVVMFSKLKSLYLDFCTCKCIFASPASKYSPLRGPDLTMIQFHSWTNWARSIWAMSRVHQELNGVYNCHWGRAAPNCWGQRRLRPQWSRLQRYVSLLSMRPDCSSPKKHEWVLTSGGIHQNVSSSNSLD